MPLELEFASQTSCGGEKPVPRVRRCRTLKIRSNSSLLRKHRAEARSGFREFGVAELSRSARTRVCFANIVRRREAGSVGSALSNFEVRFGLNSTDSRGRSNLAPGVSLVTLGRRQDCGAGVPEPQARGVGARGTGSGFGRAAWSKRVGAACGLSGSQSRATGTASRS